MENDNLNEFQQPVDLATRKQKIFTDIAELTEYIRKLNEYLEQRVIERNEDL